MNIKRWHFLKLFMILFFNSGDSFNYSNNSYFTTKGADNDNYKSNCADIFKAGWWFNACTNLNLNGEYRMPLERTAQNCLGTNGETRGGR